jgi:polyhydroxyalkanoate synthase
MVDWWQEALKAPNSLDKDDNLRVDFTVKQLLAAASPAHYLVTNPELLEQTRAEAGANLMRGAVHWFEDMQRTVENSVQTKPPQGVEGFRVGETVAATPGKVVYQNDLIELIQYTPTTPRVFAEPVLVFPAWIMKYYILDLSARNSMVRFLVDKGHTVFMVSWKNPAKSDRNLGMDDYQRLGLRAAIDAVSRILPQQKIHAVGYCIGGTLLSIGAAVLAAEGDTRIADISLFAAQTDFSEPGELAVFISPQQLAVLDVMMQQSGVLKSEQMGTAFAMLRIADLIWAPSVNSYLRGKRDTVNDLMAWNADGTRMPCRMHSEYLRGLYLDNALAHGEFKVDGKPVDLANITVPMFVVGTETDHVAPWRSVYKTGGLVNSHDYTFLLTSGGHNAGIISGPAHPKRRHRLMHTTDSRQLADTDTYMHTAEQRPDSWWPTWQQWLVAHSNMEIEAPTHMGNAAAGLAPLRDAPGEYVRG